jgi:hypothetical protein
VGSGGGGCSLTGSGDWFGESPRASGCCSVMVPIVVTRLARRDPPLPTKPMLDSEGRPRREARTALAVVQD